MTTRKRQLAWLAVAAAIAFVIAVVVSPWISPRSTNKIKVAWTSSGDPMTVKGTVKDKHGRPLAGQTVRIGTGSGDETAGTDSNGDFSMKLGECDVISIAIEGQGAIDWPLGFGIDARKGLRLEITLRCEPASSSPAATTRSAFVVSSSASSVTSAVRLLSFLRRAR